MDVKLYDSETLIKSLEHHVESANYYMSQSTGQSTMSDTDIKLTLLLLVMALEKQTVLNERLLAQRQESSKKPWYYRFIK